MCLFSSGFPHVRYHHPEHNEVEEHDSQHGQQVRKVQHLVLQPTSVERINNSQGK